MKLFSIDYGNNLIDPIDVLEEDKYLISSK